MTSVPDVTFYGASGHCRSVALLIGMPSSNPRVCDVVAFLDDSLGDAGQLLEGRRVVAWTTWLREFAGVPCVVPIGRGDLRRKMTLRVASVGGSFPRLYDDPALRIPGVTVGAGAMICPPGYIGPGTSIGDHVQVMPMHSIGHDVVIDAFATIAPGTTISGYVHVGEAAFIGAGATILNGRPGRPLVIGAGATVAAGAVVTKPVPPGVTVMGNPARPLRMLARSLRPALPPGRGQS